MDKYNKLIDDIFEEYKDDYYDYMTYDKEKDIGIVENANFEDIGRVHDWRNYIPIPFINNWDRLDLITKIGMYLMAKEQAKSERWD